MTPTTISLMGPSFLGRVLGYSHGYLLDTYYDIAIACKNMCLNVGSNASWRPPPRMTMAAHSPISLAATSVSGPAESPADADAADQECSRQPARDPTIHRTGATTHFQVFGPDR